IKVGIDSSSPRDGAHNDSASVFIYAWKTTGNLLVDNCTTTNASGVCDLAYFPGDEKVYIDEETPISISNGRSLTIYDTLQFNKLRIFYASFTAGDGSAEFAQLFTNSGVGGFADFSFDSNDQLLSGTIDQLTNNTKYVFRFASIDEAGNISNHQSVAHYLLNPTTYNETPSEVYGLLTEDMNCFITTASYNSFMHPKVQTFRAFRNKFLLPLKWGKSLVKSYYKYGPFAARALNNYPILKPITRVALWPVWLFAKLSLSMGFLFTSLIYLLTLTLLVLGVRKSLNKITA
ncbi:hypothetical protein N9W41_01575, partial [bacterium]|nr:hypothetical protein [bacterium]